MGADPVESQSEFSPVEGLKSLMLQDVKQAAAPETPPRADIAMEVSHSAANGPQRVDGPQQGDASDGEWQKLPRQYELSDFQPIKKLYRGYASKVYLAEDVGKQKLEAGQRILGGKESHKVVLKVYDLLRLSPLTKYQLDREIKLHSSVSHKNIVRLIAAFTQTDFAILVQDYAHNGDLYTFLHKQRNKFTERKIIQSILVPCMDALAYLHARNIAHRDIKPENLLLDADNNILLADFGLSVCVEDENAVTRAGTMDYMAPEVLVCPLKRLPTDYKDRKDLAYTVKVDSWSIGVLAFELIAGRTPFRHREEEDMLKTIKTTDIKFPSNMSSLACDWIKRAMAFNAHDRASIQELAVHPWITSNIPNTQSGHSRSRSSITSNSAASLNSPPSHLHRQQIGAHPEALGSPTIRQEQGRASSVFRDQGLQQAASLMARTQSSVEIPAVFADDGRSTDESRIPKAPSPSRTNSFMQHISAHLKPALFGSFRDRPTRDNQ